MKKIVKAPAENVEKAVAGSNGLVVESSPEYWTEACKHLVKKDRVMKRLIPQFGDACLQSRGDAFSTLARSIVGQQISVKAAQTVWHRFVALAEKPRLPAGKPPRRQALHTKRPTPGP